MKKSKERGPHMCRCIGPQLCTNTDCTLVWNRRRKHQKELIRQRLKEAVEKQLKFVKF
jgi:hypothetical protein